VCGRTQPNEEERIRTRCFWIHRFADTMTSKTSRPPSQICDVAKHACEEQKTAIRKSFFDERVLKIGEDLVYPTSLHHNNRKYTSVFVFEQGCCRVCEEKCKHIVQVSKIFCEIEGRVSTSDHVRNTSVVDVFVRKRVNIRGGR
jgi:hypothetical protein